MVSPGLCLVARKARASASTTSIRIVHNSRLLTQFIKSWEKTLPRSKKIWPRICLQNAYLKLSMD